MKKLLIIAAVILAIAVPFAAFAASDAPAAQAFRGACGIDSSKLTDQQKADLLNAFKKMMDVRKDIIKKAVQDGTLTKEQGDAYLKRIDDMIKYREENGFGSGFGGGFGRGMRGSGRGCGGSCIAAPPAQN